MVRKTRRHATIISSISAEGFNITGDISVQHVTAKVSGKVHLYLLMGPTGAGKSSFIESLADESQVLSISSSQLAPYTQSIAAYRVVNVLKGEHPIYLIDTPGFSDNSISELEIMDMVREWLEFNGLQYFHNILYMIPINETRLPGSKRRTIEMLREFIQPSGDLSSIVFTTSMWDQVHSDRMKQRAESNFEQLQEILQELVDDGSTLTRFENTKLSALEVLNSSFRVNYCFTNAAAYIAPRLYDNLHDLIANTLGDRKMIMDELTELDEESQANDELELILEDKLKNANKVLVKLVAQWLGFGDPPVDAELKAKQLHKDIMAANLPMESRDLELLGKWNVNPVKPSIIPPHVPYASIRPSVEEGPLNKARQGPVSAPDTPPRDIDSPGYPSKPPTPSSLTQPPKPPTRVPSRPQPTKPKAGQSKLPVTPPSKVRQSKPPITPMSMQRPKRPTTPPSMRRPPITPMTMRQPKRPTTPPSVRRPPIPPMSMRRPQRPTTPPSTRQSNLPITPPSTMRQSKPRTTSSSTSHLNRQSVGTPPPWRY